MCTLIINVLGKFFFYHDHNQLKNSEHTENQILCTEVQIIFMLL